MTQWQPTRESRTDIVSAGAARALHDLLDREGGAPGEGELLPALWHWLAFLPQARQSDIGPDGHPRTGGFLPPTDGRRRMYAGGRVEIGGGPRIGAPLHRVSVVSDVAHKSGRTGDLMFVVVDHEIESEGGRIADRNDIVYRDPAPTSASGSPAGDIDEGAVWGRDVAIDPALLFRFSALTYNAHRIHYDRGWAVDAEGYPGLVVHGPLQAILLADAAERAHPGSRITSFDFRSTAPAFDAHPLRLRVRAGEGDRVDLAAYSDGVRTMAASAVLADR